MTLSLSLSESAGSRSLHPSGFELRLPDDFPRLIHDELHDEPGINVASLLDGDVVSSPGPRSSEESAVRIAAGTAFREGLPSVGHGDKLASNRGRQICNGLKELDLCLSLSECLKP